MNGAGGDKSRAALIFMHTCTPGEPSGKRTVALIITGFRAFYWHRC